MMNDPTAPQSMARQPQLQMLIGGQIVPGCVELEVVQTGFYAADTVHAELVLDLMPAAYNAAWWSNQADIRIEFQAQLPAPGAQSGWTRLILAQIDRPTIDLEKMTVSIDGRDLSCLMREAPTAETFPNQTAAEIAQTLAARHGLTANATSTGGLVGQYYELEHSRQSYGTGHVARTEWEMLAWLARLEGADLWVDGTVLNYQPAATPTAANSWLVKYTPPASPGLSPVCNVADLKLSREQGLAKNIVVEVWSWDLKQRKAHKAVSSGGSSSAKSTTYVVIRPNMAPDVAAVYATNLRNEIAKRERTVSFWMPGELSLSPRNGVILDGTGTSFDQTYFIRSITRDFSVERGFRQDLECVNQSPATVSETTGLQ